MTPSPGPGEFLSGQLAQVDITGIENELRALWQQATQADDATYGNVVHAASFTLVLFSTDENVETELSGVLDEIMTCHPCRAILALYRANQPHDLSAWVSARCHLVGEGKHVCSEQITIKADGTSANELTSVVSPLVLPDLPVVLWWRSRTLAHAELEPLRDCARKIIFDSAYQPFTISILRQAADLLIQKADCLWLSDLNWRRLNGWRAALAEAFDGFPFEAEYLSRIKKLTITVGAYSGSQTLSTQALLLGAWLATRLNWTLNRENSIKGALSFNQNHSSITIECIAGDSKKSSNGHIQSLIMEFDDARTLELNQEHVGDSYLLTATDSKSKSKETTRVAATFSEGILVGQELENMNRDNVFEQSLLLAGEISRLIEAE